MSRAEEKYRYLSNKDKYDPQVRKAVGNKSITEKDANKINKIQEMMREEREKAGNRNIVTSENREEFMANKLGLKQKSKQMDDEQYQKAQQHPKWAVLKAKLGKRGAMDAILKLSNDAE